MLKQGLMGVLLYRTVLIKLQERFPFYHPKYPPKPDATALRLVHMLSWYQTPS